MSTPVWCCAQKIWILFGLVDCFFLCVLFTVRLHFFFGFLIICLVVHFMGKKISVFSFCIHWWISMFLQLSLFFFWCSCLLFSHMVSRFLSFAWCCISWLKRFGLFVLIGLLVWFSVLVVETNRGMGFDHGVFFVPVIDIWLLDMNACCWKFKRVNCLHRTWTLLFRYSLSKRKTLCF